MTHNFAPSLAAVLIHEGGYNNDPEDAGGATNRGITQREYDDWRARHGMQAQTVKLLNPSETEAIYREDYWDKIHADDLPSGVDYCCFDFAVNGGTNRAARYLQMAAGVVADGAIGPATLAAVGSKDPQGIIMAVCRARLDFLMRQSNFAHFGHGWTDRVHDVEAKAKAMAT